jgi:hypothetical protein
MKIIIILSIIILSVVIFKTIQAKTETQKYETVYKKGKFEIRFYPEAILASVPMDGTYDNSKNSGFRILAGYIFGGNKEEQKIAMTSPVRVTDGKEVNKMSFVLPSKMEFDNLPEPVSNKIILHQSKPVYTASIQYGGYTNNEEIAKKKTELVQILNELGVDFKEDFEYLGYNPPYQMINRKNEVLVELRGFDPDEFQKMLVSKD